MPSASFGSVGEWVAGIAAVAALLGLALQLRSAEGLHRDVARREQLAELRSCLDGLQQQVSMLRSLFHESAHDGVALLSDRGALNEHLVLANLAFERVQLLGGELISLDQLTLAHGDLRRELEADPPGGGLTVLFDQFVGAISSATEQTRAGGT